MATPAATPSNAFKILTAAQWAEWQRTGAFAGASIDLTDGYIHLSSADTAGETYEKYFANSPDPLVVVEVDLRQLGESVKWEPSRGGALFPHVYGTIGKGAVVKVWEDDDVGKALFDELVRERR
ncbi:hypothetical protein B0J12DRAFT_111121 [Macrophomina phaseolina]|uniref:DUF952 domain-containing protein n=1 Tax=Macrophomina phaseolina TaxID=35725 RepID=A0ABQ8G8K8_9PEZI|nr:hypothetical protein B0J12DRAFT_111121 [Macrophomina phaseolina]